ncbi:methyltransferase [Coralliovum pocilloporae]|uniref:methyltransferase n=1 Tax=Coralliovum pocilloporae TaxID=3066369 RepID=UPI003306C9D3
MAKIEDEALAEAYNKALELEKSGNFDAAAEAYEDVLLLDPEDHGGAAVRLAAMRRGEVPEKASDAYVTTLFDQHAEVFDAILVGQLGYAVPMMVRQMLPDHADGTFERLLDLGCGTGLSGETLDDMVDHSTGVDLSEGMLNEAWDREVYDDLYAGEAVQFIREAEDENWDLITATDVLPYIGKLEEFFRYVSLRLDHGGVLAFSTETLPDADFGGADYMVTPQHRFAHRLSYVQSLMKRNALSVLAVRDITVRDDEGEPIPGHLIIGRKANG